MSTAALLPTSALMRRRGRPRTSDSHSERIKHIRCAYMLLSGDYTTKGIAALFEVSIQTVYNWRDLALGYDDAEAEGLRRMYRARN